MNSKIGPIFKYRGLDLFNENPLPPNRFVDEKNSGSVAPTLASLYAFAEEIRLLELSRFSGRLDGLTEAQKKAVESLTYGIVQKMLHRPVAKVREHSGSKRGERLVEDLSFLFDL